MNNGFTCHYNIPTTLKFSHSLTCVSAIASLGFSTFSAGRWKLPPTLNACTRNLRVVSLGIHASYILSTSVCGVLLKSTETRLAYHQKVAGALIYTLLLQAINSNKDCLSDSFKDSCTHVLLFISEIHLLLTVKMAPINVWPF